MPMSITRAEPSPQPEKFFDAGGEHFHVHTCPASADHPVHPWKCNSPYCENMVRVCPEHGGKDPVTKGEEPWRG